MEVPHQIVPPLRDFPGHPKEFPLPQITLSHYPILIFILMSYIYNNLNDFTLFLVFTYI